MVKRLSSDPAARRGPSPKPVALRVELLDIEPLIWRRIMVSNQSTLASLHNYLQWVMGWQDSHAHEFEVGDHTVLDELGLHDLPLAGLAKEREELFLPRRAEPVVLPPTSPALYLVQRLRDEAHRFAITYHRSLRAKRSVRSAFDDRCEHLVRRVSVAPVRVDERWSHAAAAARRMATGAVEPGVQPLALADGPAIVLKRLIGRAGRRRGDLVGR